MATSSSIEVLGKAITEFCQSGKYVDDVDLSSKIETAELKNAYELIGKQKTIAKVDILNLIWYSCYCNG